jgi:predicted ABC-type transport system involved in lysophospholipase L1 biosynthesis ATPase subunit
VKLSERPDRKSSLGPAGAFAVWRPRLPTRSIMKNGLVISSRYLGKAYRRHASRVVALQDTNVDIYCGEFVALMGPSGSGKSTRVHLIAAMDRPTEGEIRVLGEDLQLPTCSRAWISSRVK